LKEEVLRGSKEFAAIYFSDVEKLLPLQPTRKVGSARAFVLVSSWW
jgi:hypothetical protein